MIKKILIDTLTTKGKYSRKNLTMLCSFIIGVIIGFIIIIGECLSIKFDKTLYVFDTFMIMSGYNGLLTVVDKKLQNKVENNVN